MTKPQRAITLLLALLFLGTSVAFTVLVIAEMRKEDKQNTAQTSLDNTPQEGQLKGTQLADFSPTENVSELQKVDLVVGNGEEVKAGATVTAHYTGAVASTGNIFESSLDSGQPATFPLSGVIKGWQDGVPGMKVGGKRRLIIPAEQAYGAQSPSPDIPANSALVFDIELISIQQ